MPPTDHASQLLLCCPCVHPAMSVNAGTWASCNCNTQTVILHRVCGKLSKYPRAGGPPIVVATTGTTAAAAGVRHHTPLTLQEYDDFELLWLEYRHELSVNKEAALRTLECVQLGLLPSDADLLRDRAQRFTALSQQIAKLDTRRLLNTSNSLLGYDARHLEFTVKKLLQLIPRSSAPSPTQLVLDTAADLDLPAEIVALQYQELGSLFKACLGTWITQRPFHHLVQRLRRRSQWQPQQQQQQPQQQQQQPVFDSPFKQVLDASAGVSEQLSALKQLLGPELTHSAVLHTPELLDAPVAQVQASLQWLQHQLRLSPVAAMLLAEQHGQVLQQPVARLEQNYSNLCYLLQQLVGWRWQQVHSMLYNTPVLLVKDSQLLASNWQSVQRISKKRLPWMKELAAAEAPLLTSILNCNRRQMLMLQYAAETGDLKSKGLLQILRMEYADFMRICAGFRTWRSMGPGRWRIVEASSSAGTSGGNSEQRNDSNNLPEVTQSAERAAVSQQRHADEQVHAISSNQEGAAAVMKPYRKVLAVDRLNRPILVQVGELGPYDRLA
eukprot:GHUV01012686.1.p1 GENE.GHUV01012686.1~~GHUV01012686.1.p1  ORF type:complete len:554 (+),score=180.02 GHUV01012686.1:1134-2795(+)